MEVVVDDDDREAIPLEEPNTDDPVIPPPPPPNSQPPSDQLDEAASLLQAAVPLVRTWMEEIHEWELLEPAAGDVLAFAHRHESGLFRVAGRLRAPASMVIARLKDHMKETRLTWDPDVSSVECLTSFGDNMEHVRSVVRMPMNMAPVTIEGIQHTTFMEESRTYFYLFASLDGPKGGVGVPDATLTVGVTVRELDKDTGCEVNAVFQCRWHTHWTVAWLVDPLLLNHFFNAERMVSRALLYGGKQ